MRKLAVQCAVGQTVTSDNRNTNITITYMSKGCGNSKSTCQFSLGISLSTPVLGVKLAGEFGKTPIHCTRTNNRLSMFNPFGLELSPHFPRAG